MNTFTTNHETFTKATTTLTKINVARLDTVRDTINLCINESKAHQNEFTSKKNAIAAYINNTLGKDIKVDNYFKRSLKIAKLILVDGYKIKLELLTLAQMEHLTSFNKNTVNALMTFDDDLYNDKVKSLIKTAKVVKSTKVFSKAAAKVAK